MQVLHMISRQRFNDSRCRSKFSSDNMRILMIKTLRVIATEYQLTVSLLQTYLHVGCFGLLMRVSVWYAELCTSTMSIHACLQSSTVSAMKR